MKAGDDKRVEAIGELDDEFFANARVRQGGRILCEGLATRARRGRQADREEGEIGRRNDSQSSAPSIIEIMEIWTRLCENRGR